MTAIDIGLTADEVNKLNAIFSTDENIDEVILYGSRAMGTYRPSSDIDLTMVGEKLNTSSLYKIQNSIDDLMLPYQLDLSIFHTLENKELVEHIQRVGKVLYRQGDCFF